MSMGRWMIALALGLALGGTASVVRAEDCFLDTTEWDNAAAANDWTIQTLAWQPFGQDEAGWEPYLPLIQNELGTSCAPGSAVFSQRLADWQTRYQLPATGVFDPATFQALRGVWQERRPFIMARVRGDPCPDPPPLHQMAYLTQGEEQANRLTRLLRRDVLEAWRRMAEAARAEVPEIAANPELLQIFSGYRDPEADAQRCAETGACDGLRRAICSAHRTGTAVDLYVGQAPGLGVSDTSIESRRHMARTPAYRWLVRNAHRFGFVPYVYEPWHWEWVSPTGGYVAAAP